MALFPAFAAVSEAPDGGSSRRELDWLSNPSFCVGRAASPSQPAEEATVAAVDPSLPTRSPVKSESSEDSDAERRRRQTSRKKKKEKKRKRKRQHQRRARSKRGSSRSSDSESDSDSGRDSSARGVGAGARAPGQPSSGDAAEPGRRLVWLEDAQALTGDTFRTDKKPDPANWEYKSLYRGDIARYKRKGDSCLGLNPKKQCVSWEGAPRQKKPPRGQGERYFSRRNVGLMDVVGDVVNRCSDPPASAPADFIPVTDPDESARPVTSWLNPLGIYDAATTQWLQGQGPSEQDARVPDAQPDREGAMLRAKVEDFNRRVRESPRDVQLWMDFVAFQDEAMRRPGLYALEADGEPRRRATLRLVLEKKLAILERALESNQGSVELQLARLRICAELWEPGALAKEWQKLLFLHPNDAALWQRYLLFCQSQFSTFSVSRLLGVYGKCLSTLSAVQDGSILSHPALPGTEDALLALFLQQCHFLRQAGHTEKAVSLFQAMVDFTFFKPDSVKELPTRSQVEFFEPFWDSGEPRAGEKGARGWRAWMHQQERGGWVIVTPEEEEDEADDEDQEIRDRTLPRWQIWLEAERSREQRHWRPWRPENKKQTEEDCEDPERQVLFDDIGQSLIRLTRPELRFQLVTAFLQFLGVPCGARPPATCLYLALDEDSLFDGGLSDEQPLTAPQLPFSGIGCVGRTHPLGGRRGTRGHSREGEDFIRNLLHLLLPLFAGPERAQLCLSWLRYEVAKVLWCLHTKNKRRLKSRGKNCKKLAKSLLREPENRGDFRLWQQYAHLEWLLGNTDDARKVFEAALGAAGGQALQDGGLCELGLLYAALELELAPDPRGAAAARAVHILTRLTESEPGAPAPAQASAVPILKARKAYEHALEACLQEEGCRSAPTPQAPGRLASVAKCFMLFQYLTVGIEASVRLHDQVSAKLREPTGAGPEQGPPPSHPGPVLEALTLLHTSLLCFHMRVSVYPLGPLRQALSEALKLYPDNQGLWRAYVQVQNKSHSASKTRRFFDAVIRSTKALEPWLFAIEAEKMRKKLVETVQRVDGREVHATLPESGLTHRIRGLLESAVRSEGGSQCPLLWRMYLRFLVSLGNKERSKGVFYKALQSCPWAKALYMDAVECFPDETQEILDLMTEKELRVRLPLEELELLLQD